MPRDATWFCGAVVVEHRYIGPIIGGATNGLVVTVMARYVKPTRPEPTSEEFLALLILLGPLAYVVRWA